jgi:hypothetical protein
VGREDGKDGKGGKSDVPSRPPGVPLSTVL